MIDARLHDRGGPRSRRPGRRLVIWLGVLAALIAFFFVARFAYHQLKMRRANQLTAQGRELVAAKKWNDAAEKYRAALQLDPLNYQALRAAAELAGLLDRPEDVDLWAEVAKLPQCTTADRQEYVAALMKHGRFKSAELILDPMLKTDPDARTLLLAAQYAQKNHDNPKAIEFTRLAAKRAPDDDMMKFRVAEALALSPDADQQKEARGILWELAGKQTATRTAVIEAIAKAPDLSDEERQRIIPLLESIEPANVNDALLAADLRLLARTDDPAKIYDRTVTRWNDGQNTDLAQLGRWLNSNKQPERALALFPLEKAFADDQLLLVRLDALAALQRWDEIDSLLGHPSIALDPAVIECFRARTAQERGSVLDAEVHWNHALSLASGEPAKLRFVAHYAEQSRNTAVALKALDRLAKFPEHADYAYRATQSLSARSGDVGTQREAAEKISSGAPDDPNSAAQLAYLNLLMNRDVEANVTAAKALVKKDPSRLSFRVAAALGYLRQNDPGAAIAQFKPEGAPEIDWPKTPPNWRAVYAAALLATEQTEAARAIIDSIPKDKLAPEERALIEAPAPSPRP